MKSLLLRAFFSAGLALLVGSQIGNSQNPSFGCYIGTVCVSQLKTCSCNQAEYYTQGYQAGHHGSACDLFYGAPCSSGCGEHGLTGNTHPDNYCIGQGIPIDTVHPVLDIDSQARKQDFLGLNVQARNMPTKSESECEVANLAFKTWVENAMRRTK